SDELSLCFDPTTESLGEVSEGDALFDDEGQPADATKRALEFCQHFEEAGQRTKAFIDELKKHDLLMDGEIAISMQDNPDRPYVYRGFQMINQEKLREVRGAVLRTWCQNALLPLIYAHMSSLDLRRAIFARQQQQGKGPELVPAATN